jgi:hypothetical protein
VELIGILAFLAIAGLCAVLCSLVLLPFVLLLKLIGFGLRLTFGAIGLVLAGLVGLPLLALIGGILLFKLVLLAMPLLLLAGFVAALIAISRRQASPA